MNFDRGRRPPSPGNPYRHPGGRTYRLMYATALLAVSALAVKHRVEIGDVWRDMVAQARTRSPR